MNELNIPYYLFIPYTVFGVIFIYQYYRYQKKQVEFRNKFWSNAYIFEIIPSVFPTIGILCTAIGIMVGLRDFNPENIQESIPTLIKGLRLAFYATIAGIVGLIIFQKICAVVQKSVDEDPNRPPKQSDEITALANLNAAVIELKNEMANGFKNTQNRFEQSLELKVTESIKSLQVEVKDVKKELVDLSKTVTSSNQSSGEASGKILAELSGIREDNFKATNRANENTGQIIEAMGRNNELIRNKFDEFSELLKKNNTEALVEVMKRATEDFNQQMSALINKLVQENFKELNNSVKSLNDWQKENKEQISKLTANFQLTTESFAVTSRTLAEVAANTERLTSDNGKLNQMINELKKVLIEDGKFQEVTRNLVRTIETLDKTTNSFDETTNKLNGWVRTQMNFNDKAEVLIRQLEDFRNLNGDVWEKYRAKMDESVGIISKASKALSSDLNNINQQFVESLNSTLTSLDECIQRIVNNRRA